MLAFVSRSRMHRGQWRSRRGGGIHSSRKHGGVVDRPSVTQTRHARATTIPGTRSSGSSVRQSLFSRPWRGGTDFTWRVISSRDWRELRITRIFFERNFKIPETSRAMHHLDILYCVQLQTRKRVLAILMKRFPRNATSLL